MKRLGVFLAAVLGAAGAGRAWGQTLAQRVAAAADGTVRLSYASRPGVCGDGANNISFDCSDGTCGHHRISFDDGWAPDSCACEAGPVRAAVQVSGGRVTRLRAYVGGHWLPASAGVTDLGVVSAPEAARWLLDLARSGASRASEQAVFLATLADSVTVWPDLLRLARDAEAPTRVKSQAVFWLGQAAGEVATKDLADLALDDSVDRQVREQAVFALSQQPRDVGVPALIGIARTNRDPEVRRRAFFWLGQTRDPRALALFEEVLTRP